MIKRLRIKFIIIIMSLLSLVLLAIFGSLNIMMNERSESTNRNQLVSIAENDGVLSRSGSAPKEDGRQNGAERPFGFFPFDAAVRKNYFAVKLDHEGNITEVVSDFRVNYSDSDISALVEAARSAKSDFGRTDGQHFYVMEKPYGSIIVFIDCRMQDNLLTQLLLLSLGVTLASLVAVFLIALFLSRRAIRPVQTAFEKQRRFVADASHELKTPLTTISANADVLSCEIGENKWLSYIKSEAARMSDLVTDLLYLAKYDSRENVYSMKDFDLSTAVMSAVLPFESVAFEAGKTLTSSIDPDIRFTGDEGRIKQLVLILLDNAIKNSFEHGEISVRLTLSGARRVLCVKNTGAGIDEADKEKIFERFYRGDSSRDRATGGFGLGLAIAKSIVDAHGGRIGIASEKGAWVEFTVTL